MQRATVEGLGFRVWGLGFRASLAERLDGFRVVRLMVVWVGASSKCPSKASQGLSGLRILWADR